MSVPYSAFSKAIKQLVLQVLQLPDEQVEKWKAKINNAISINGQVIVEIIPELELLIGKQAELQHLDPERNQNRFNCCLTATIPWFLTFRLKGTRKTFNTTSYSFLFNINKVARFYFVPTVNVY